MMVLIQDKKNKKEVNPMNDEQKAIWKDKDTISVQSSIGKVDFNRYTLANYMVHYHPNKDNFFNYFNEESVTKMDEETGCYMSHLVCRDAYFYSNVQIILEILFDGYLTPRTCNKRGEFYIEYIVKNSHFSDYNLCDAFARLIDLYHIDPDEVFDFQGNSLFNWLAIGPHHKSLSDFLPFFSFYPLSHSNKNGCTVYDYWNLAELLYSSNYFYRGHFTVRETDNYLIINTCRPVDNDYKKFNRKFDIQEILMDYQENIYYKDDEILQYLITNNHWKSIYNNKPSKLSNNSFGTYFNTPKEKRLEKL